MEGALIVAAIAITGGGSAIWYGLNRRKKWRDNLVRVSGGLWPRLHAGRLYRTR